ncbi:E3 ubiquitin-protein ligase RNF10 [Phlebotomus argentipes]|uniref:E3 ubiquitin-protein ligase RNF10 n=1 Tax=Phlebotomus argentipes TaxID=94469 RepID=UPI0028937FAB|nr:E3 ubiquitin-protein ligase RNF10 [Phlebotomus argentipes]
MEKKANIRVTHLVPKGPASECKKQDASSKQWPRNSRRREPNGYAGSKDPTRARVPNGHQQRIDKKPPRGRGSQASSEPQGTGKGGDLASSGSGAGLAGEEEDPVAQYELNSVFLPGSKKQNLNHLLNFHYAPRKVNSFTIVREFKGKSWGGKRMHFSKEQFLQANCQFVVKSSGEYGVHRGCPDTLVKWDQIEQIIIHSNEDAQCPICLYAPVAGKMTRCGHVYCWACILHYLALSDKSWRKCPICYEPVYVADLKSAVANYHHEFKTEEVVTLKLMKRKKGSLNVVEASKDCLDSDPLPHLFESRDAIVHSKLIVADIEEVLSIVDHEQRELLQQMEIDGPDGLNCPETMFIQQALDLLSERKAVLNQLQDAKEESESSSQAEDAEAIANDSSDYFYFYQAIDGQNLYLHTINNRMIQAQFGELHKGPETLSGRIVQKDSFTMEETLRKRLKYLQHLPMTCQFDVVEIVFDTPIVSPEIMKTFDEELKSRAKNRKVRAREEKIREIKINEVYDRQMGKLLSQPVDINIESPKDFPLYGGLTERPLEMNESPVENKQGPSFAKMLSSPSEGAFWPSLMDKKASVVVESPWSKSPSTGDVDGETSVPDFRRAFSSDMAVAMEKAEASRKECESKKASHGKGKKKQQMVLFSTDMNFKRN